MLVFTESGHHTDEIDEIDEDALELALYHTDPHWSSQARVWQRLEMHLPAASFPKFLPQALRAGGVHWCDLRERHHMKAGKTFGGTEVYKGMDKQKPGLGYPDVLCNTFSRWYLTGTAPNPMFCSCWITQVSCFCRTWILDIPCLAVFELMESLSMPSFAVFGLVVSPLRTCQEVEGLGRGT